MILKATEASKYIGVSINTLKTLSVRDIKLGDIVLWAYIVIDKSTKPNYFFNVSNPLYYFKPKAGKALRGLLL